MFIWNFWCGYIFVYNVYLSIMWWFVIGCGDVIKCNIFVVGNFRFLKCQDLVIVGSGSIIIIGGIFIVIYFVEVVIFIGRVFVILYLIEFYGFDYYFGVSYENIQYGIMVWFIGVFFLCVIIKNVKVGGILWFVDIEFWVICISVNFGVNIDNYYSDFSVGYFFCI